MAKPHSERRKSWPTKARLGRKAGRRVRGGKQVHQLHKPEFSKTWTKADRKEMRWKDATISFHEAGLQIKDTRVS